MTKKPKTKIVCDDPEISVLDPVRPWRATDRLTPAPPQGWLLVLTLSAYPYGTEVGAWITALSCIVNEERRRGTPRRHQITRDPSGSRVLVVHPKLGKFVRTLVRDFDDVLENCNCGGTECLAGDEQYKALLVLARKAWPKLSPADRIDAVQLNNDCDEEIPIRGVVDRYGKFIKDGISSSFLENVIQTQVFMAHHYPEDFVA